MLHHVAARFHELFILQPNKGDEAVKYMNDLSRAYGILLHCTDARSDQICSSYTPRLCEKVSQNFLQYAGYEC